MSEFTLYTKANEFPSPSEPTYYWYKATPWSKEIPLLIEPAQNGYPPMTYINGQNIEVPLLKGAFRATNHLPSQTKAAKQIDLEEARKHFVAGAFAMAGIGLDELVKEAADQYIAKLSAKTRENEEV